MFSLLRHGISFGESDPYFGADLGFFVYWLPVELTLYGWAFSDGKDKGLTAPLVGGDGWDSPRLFEIGGDAFALHALLRADDVAVEQTP